MMNAAVETLPEPPSGKRRQVLVLIAVVFIVIGLLWGLFWLLVLSKRERTDDAYVNGNKVVISAQVSGTVIAVLADDTQLVKAGQVLVRLDPVDAETGLARSASALGQSVRQVRQQKLNADQYDAMIATRRGGGLSFCLRQRGARERAAGARRADAGRATGHRLACVGRRN